MRGIHKLKMVSRKLTFTRESKLDLRAPDLIQDLATPLEPGKDGNDGKHGVNGATGKLG